MSALDVPRARTLNIDSSHRWLIRLWRVLLLYCKASIRYSLKYAVDGLESFLGDFFIHTVEFGIATVQY